MSIMTHDSLCPKQQAESAFCACAIIERARLGGFKAGILDAGWVCQDCGNTYESFVDTCPNKNLDSVYAAEKSFRYVARSESFD